MARPSLNEEERHARRRQLLDAAHQLFRVRGALPTVADIAQAAGFAKGSVYLSFSTKEEIFIGLLEDSFGQLLARLAPLVHSLPPTPAGAASMFATHYIAALGELPDLLPLAAMTSSVLEKNLPLAAMLQFKQGLAAALEAAGAALDAAPLGLAPGAGADLLLHTWGLTIGLWQALDYPDEVRACIGAPATRILDRDFGRELQTALGALWRGSLLPA